MERNVDIEEISDGKRYGLNDMVKADCGGCAGCFDCCTHMEETILLSPFDVFRMETGLKIGFEELLARGADLKVFDGVIFPVIRMAGEEERCAFLDVDGRCSIHAYRPDICRMFPLGRIYENDGFSYFLQTKECPYPNKTKVKVKKWLDCEDLEKNQQFVKDWHSFVREVQKQGNERDLEWLKAANQQILQVFYLMPYDVQRDFYGQFYERLSEFKEKI